MSINKIINDIGQIDDADFPPVDKWDPEICEGQEIKIDRDGNWFFNHSLIENLKLVYLFSKVLKKDGILTVVTFHSLEDKIVKYFLKNLSENKSISRYVPKMEQPETLFKMIEKKPKTPSKKELRENVPSRSAKLRYAIKKDNLYNFETDILKKFEHLIEIENFDNKL